MSLNAKVASADAPKKFNFEMPDIKEFLKVGVQFGHQSKKWNPKMKSYIFGKKENIHIIDISQSLPALQEAMQFLAKAASEGSILLVGTKRQAADIVKKTAIETGAHYITHRWPGGLLTNFEMIQRSLKKFMTLEHEFKTGVEGRTKFEVSQMKKDWEKMNRLYEGVKTMTQYPKAVVVIDSNYERNAIKEARVLNIPVIGLVDTNCDPEAVDYAIPANDDAIGSINLLVGLLGKAIKTGNGGRGIKHELIDYSTYEVKIVRIEQQAEKKVEIQTSAEVKTETPRPAKIEKKATKATKAGKGLLEDIQKNKETAKRQKATKARK